MRTLLATLAVVAFAAPALAEGGCSHFHAGIDKMSVASVTEPLSSPMITGEGEEETMQGGAAADAVKPVAEE